MSNVFGNIFLKNNLIIQHWGQVPNLEYCSIWIFSQQLPKIQRTGSEPWPNANKNQLHE
jgi:hypothetical protein